MEVRTDRLGKRIFVVGFGALFLLGGLGFAGGPLVEEVRDFQKQQSVTTTEGTVVSTGVVSLNETEGGETDTECYPRVNYTYTVDGRTYDGTRVYFPSETVREQGELRGKDFDDCTVARDVVAGYETGASVTVYHYPDDPARAALRIPTFEWTVVVAVLFGLVFAVPGGLLVRYGLTAALGDGDDEEDTAGQ